MTAGLGGVGLAVAGCDVLDGPDDGAGPGVSGEVGTTAPAADVDSALVDEVASAIAAMGALATAVGTAHPGLAAAGTRLAKIHRSHARRLGLTTDAPAPSVPAEDRKAALTRLLAAEKQLQGRLVAAARAAESGALAQVLAAMAAAVAQQRSVLA